MVAINIFIKTQMRNIIIFVLLFSIGNTFAQQDSTSVYKKRVLETTEVDFITSYYLQDGKNAATTGGIGSEELTDIATNIVVNMPLNEDDILTVNVGVSAYSSASSSNVDPFDGNNTSVDVFQASSGASEADTWFNVTGAYSHSSDDRNNLWSANVSVSSEYDYFSLGFGGSYTKLFNEKNTELSISGNVYLDTWNAIYPSELRGTVAEFSNEGRNSYSLGLGLSQILSKNLQGSLLLDVVKQDGLLSTPFHRIYFADVSDTNVQQGFLGADDIERLPDSRFKVAVGGRLNYYVNEIISLRSYYRFYSDDWGISSHTASLEVPIKITDKFTLYPSYRYYKQTEADYFLPYNKHLSTSEFYTSDYDLSKYTANQFSFGVSYTDIFAKAHIWKFGIKSIDFKFNNYSRDTGLDANNFTLGFKFVMD